MVNCLKNLKESIVDKILKRYDANMDSEVIKLCNALNNLPGIITTESCCGHGTQPFKVWFRVDGRVDHLLQGLFFLTRCIDRRYWKYGDQWSLSLSVGDTTKNGILPTEYLLKSTATGNEAYGQVHSLLLNMKYHLNHDIFQKMFDINLKSFGLLQTALSKGTI